MTKPKTKAKTKQTAKRPKQTKVVVMVQGAGYGVRTTDA